MKIDAYAISRCETEYFVIDPEDAPLIEQIRGVYMFDYSRRTFCCEVTPSYRLIFLYHQVYLREDLSENRRGDLYEKYESAPGDDIYVHCCNIDMDSEWVISYGLCNYDDYDERMEEIQDDICSDWPF